MNLNGAWNKLIVDPTLYVWKPTRKFLGECATKTKNSLIAFDKFVYRWTRPIFTHAYNKLIQPYKFVFQAPFKFIYRSFRFFIWAWGIFRNPRIFFRPPGIVVDNFVLGVSGNNGKLVKQLSPTTSTVSLPNKTYYRVFLANDNNVLCDCELSVDSTKIGTFRMQPKQIYYVEKAPNGGKLYFVEDASAKDVPEFSKLSMDWVPENGVITAKFTPQQTHFRAHSVLSQIEERSESKRLRLDESKSMSAPQSASLEGLAQPEAEKKKEKFVAGRTAFVGYSSQYFTQVHEIQLDATKAQTLQIYLLVEQ